MRTRNFGERARAASAIALAAAMVIGFGILTGLAASQYVVSQKGREFTPRDVTMKRGEVLLIVNDDADLRHQVYVDSDRFSFDSGDQEPGSKTSIAFPVGGTFEVLCAIHPKMKLSVHVQ